MHSASLPSVGVIIPTRDRVDMLRRAMDSVWAQDYSGPMSVVVVFDGPVPDSVVLPQPASPNRDLRVVSSPGPKGLVPTRSHGAGLLVTDFVALLDDDDEWLPLRLSTQMKLAQAHSELELVGGGVRVVHREKNVERPAPLEVVNLSDLLDDRIMELHPSTFLIKTEALRAIGGWDPDLPGGFAEDYDLLLRIARRGPIRLVPEVIAIVNWAGDSYFFSRWQIMAAALERLLVKFPEFSTSPRGRGRIRGQIAFAQAAMGERRAALQSARSALADNRREPRALLAVLVAVRLISADRIQGMLHRRGRGI